jgi:ubiquitin carboxyl-terminal hydrolase 7
LLPNALKKIFSDLDSKVGVVDTLVLTDAFGWSRTEYMQSQDLNEFVLVLFSSLEEILHERITNVVDSTLTTFIKTLSGETMKSREEKNRVISLCVKNFRTLYESFDDLLKDELLDGDNQYQNDNYQKVDARKGMEITSLAPTLLLNLVRYTFDYNTFNMVKVTDRLDYPEELNLSKYTKNKNDVYTLIAVTTHVGSVNSGHRYQYARPYSNTQDWYEFNDSKVTQVSAKVALEQVHTAILLEYVRTSEITEYLDKTKELVIGSKFQDTMFCFEK